MAASGEHLTHTFTTKVIGSEVDSKKNDELVKSIILTKREAFIKQFKLSSPLSERLGHVFNKHQFGYSLVVMTTSNHPRDTVHWKMVNTPTGKCANKSIISRSNRWSASFSIRKGLSSYVINKLTMHRATWNMAMNRTKLQDDNPSTRRIGNKKWRIRIGE